jgi:PAS domain S-box-containing protein
MANNEVKEIMLPSEVLDKFDVGIYIYQDGKFMYVNRKLEEISKYGREELYKMNPYDLIHPDYREQIALFTELAMNLKMDSLPPSVQFKAIDKHGNEIWVEARPIPVIWNGKPAIMGNIVDISEKVAAQRRVEELAELLKLINRILRHDITNNLTVVAGYIDLYLDLRDEMQLYKAREMINNSIYLLSRMKEFQNLIEPERTAVDVDLTEVVRKLRDKYPEVDIRFSGDSAVVADDMFQSILENLVDNAVRHGGSNVIEISHTNNGDVSELKVADNGKGIPDEIKDRIFEEGFFYGERGNTGLGLYIVKKVVERYGGEIKVEDNSPGGTVFIIRFKKLNGQVEISRNNRH